MSKDKNIYIGEVIGQNSVCFAKGDVYMNRLKRILIVTIIISFIIQPMPVHAKSRIDMVFIIDSSGSMGGDINDVRREINNFTEQLSNQGLDYRLGLVSYEEYANSYTMTSNVEAFAKNLRSIDVDGGTENGLDAIVKALDDYIFYDNAIKYFVLIGDEEIYSRRNRYSEQQVKNLLKSNDIILTTVGESRNRSQFQRLANATGGLYLELGTGFSTNLQTIFDQIQAIPMLEIISPTPNQLLSDFNSPFIPTVKASDPDSDTLYFEYYIGSETSPRDTKTVSNTQTAQTVSFKSLDIGSLSEGNHTLRFTVNDGSETVQDTVNITVDNKSPSLGAVTFVPTDTAITISGTATDDISGLAHNPYRYTIGSNTYSWSNTTSYIKSHLNPNTEYYVKFEARDKVGHISSREDRLYTKAQTPNIEIDRASETSLNIRTRDNNPATTRYQIKIGSKYVSQTGRLTSRAAWITLNNKEITATGLNPNTTYDIAAKARNHDGIETVFSSQITVTTLAKPPSNITLKPERNSIKVSWSPVSGASSYEIEVDGSVINNGKSTSYTHSGLAPNTQHRYRVRVRNLGGAGNWSSIKSEYTLPNPPGIPSNIRTSVQQTKITINWDTVLGAESYYIEVDGLVINNGINTTFVHESLEPETEHTYRIKAKNRGGESNWSQEIKEITLPYPPETPTNINTEITYSSVALTWDKMEGATGYEIKVDGLIIDNGENVTYLHEGLEPLSGHTYSVRAKNRGGKSPWSSKVDITTHPANPNTPANVMATSEENLITVTWYKIPHAESYDIEVDGTVITDLTDTMYIHRGLGSDTSHTYRVRAKNISGISEWSIPLNMWTLPSIEDGGSEGSLNIALTNIVAVVTNNEITISWDAVAPDVEYEIEVDGELKNNEKNTIYKHSGLKPNSYHSYKIRVISEEGISNWCGVLSLSTLPELPDAPKNIVAYPANNSIELRWERIEGATGYDVEIDGVTVDIGTDINHIHDNLQPGTSHTYRVRAKNIAGVTAWSPAIIKSTTNPTYTINTIQDSTFDLSLLASNVQDFTQLKFIVTYDSSELELMDLYKFTPEKDILKEGKIPNTDLVVKYTPGRIEFTVDRNIVPGKSWSGEISNILFKTKVSGEINIDFDVE